MVAVSCRSVLYILGLCLSLEEILSERFPYTVTRQTYTGKPDGLKIELELKPNRTCFIDVYLNSEPASNNKTDSTTRPPQTPGEIKLGVYSGQIRGVNDSWVTVIASGGSGVSGVIYDGREDYNITNLEASKTGALSVVDKMTVSIRNNVSKMNFDCGDHDSSGTSNETEENRFERDLFSNAKFVIEMVLVVDNTFYKAMGSNITLVHQRVENITKELNTIFEEFKIFVDIVCLNVWKAGNKITVVNDHEDFTSYNFQDYAGKYLKMSNVDNVQLLSNVEFPSRGKSIKYGMCNSLESYGVNYDPLKPTTPRRAAFTLAHQLAYNFGINEDSTNGTCVCDPSPPDSHCIMWPKQNDYIVGKWSNCSRAEFTTRLSAEDHHIECLTNKTDNVTSVFNTSCEISIPEDKVNKNGSTDPTTVLVVVVLVIVTCLLIFVAVNCCRHDEELPPLVGERFDPEDYQSHWKSPSGSVSFRCESDPRSQSRSSFSEMAIAGKTIITVADVENYPKSTSSESQPCSQIRNRRKSQQTLKSSSSVDTPMQSSIVSHDTSSEFSQPHSEIAARRKSEQTFKSSSSIDMPMQSSTVSHGTLSELSQPCSEIAGQRNSQQTLKSSSSVDMPMQSSIVSHDTSSEFSQPHSEIAARRKSEQTFKPSSSIDMPMQTSSVSHGTLSEFSQPRSEIAGPRNSEQTLKSSSSIDMPMQSPVASHCASNDDLESAEAQSSV